MIEMIEAPVQQRSPVLHQQSRRKSFNACLVPNCQFSNASHSAVIYKLLGFTLAMIAGPIGTYFLTLNTIFKGCLSRVPHVSTSLRLCSGNSTWAGATAAIMANVVLIAYVIVAMKEDESEKLEAEQRAKKGN